jgi:predicted nucleotidyltransferase
VQGESREHNSPGSWYMDVFPGFIEQCRELILKEAEMESVAGLILAGSFASSEGSIVLLGGKPLFLSDIDLLLIVSSSASHARLYPRRSEIGKKCESLLPGALFEGGIDVGVMTRDELAAMPL